MHANGYDLGLHGECGGRGAATSSSTGGSAPDGRSSTSAARGVRSATTTGADGTAGSAATAGRRCPWRRNRPPACAAARRRRPRPAGSRSGACWVGSTPSWPCCRRGGGGGGGGGNPTATTPARDRRVRQRGRCTADRRPLVGSRGGRRPHSSSHRCGRLTPLSAPPPGGVKDKPEPPRVQPHIPHPSIVHVAHYVRAGWREIVNDDRVAPHTAANAQLQPLPGECTVRGGESPERERHLYRRPSASARTG